jgi:hypothetical protein
VSFVPYIVRDEYDIYGITDATDAQINAASRIVNTYLARPEGLLCSPGADGQPAYMTNLTPTQSLTVPSQIDPGSNVVVTVPNYRFGLQHIGEVAILSRTTSDITEACVITAVSEDTATLDTVKFTHPAQSVMDLGLTILQELPVPSGRSTVRLARNPVARLISGYGRYATGRRSQQFAGADFNSNLLFAVGAFGGPPAWVPFPIDQTDINLQTGEVWIPAGLLLSYFSDVRLRYVAGWTEKNLPGDIKQAVANIVRAAIDSPFFGGNVKTMKAGDATLERFSASSIDKDTQALLQPYKTLLMA